jgi:hypothetical protein
MMTYSASSGSWENGMADDYTSITNLLLNNYKNGKFFFLPFCWLDENSGCFDAG